MKCTSAALKDEEKIFDCHASNREYQDFKQLLNATKENIQRDLREVEESLQGRFRITMSDRPKRAIIPILWGIDSAAFGISRAVFAHKRRESLKGSVKQLYNNYGTLKEQHLLLQDRTIPALKETSDAIDTLQKRIELTNDELASAEKSL